MPLSFDEILSLVKAGSTEPLPAGRIDRRLEAPRSADDPDDYVNVGLNGVVASTSKLLAVNRGVADEDVRDSWAFKRVMEPSRMLRERIRMDADGSAKKVMRGLARKRSLDAFTPYQFDGYATGLFLGNPLASPLEEINPMHIIEQQRRITLMGPGGIGSPDAITPSMQAIHGSQFGYISVLEGPESERAGVDSRLAWGVRIGSDGRLYQQMRNRRTGKTEWVSPEQLVDKVLKIPD